jgi:hypothetical protein
VVHVCERVGLGESKVVGNVLALKVAPGLRVVNDGPLVVGTKVHGLVRGDPVVGTGTEALALVVALLGVFVVEPVRQQVVGLVGEGADGSEMLGRARVEDHTGTILLYTGDSLVPDGQIVLGVDLDVGIGKTADTSHGTKVL